jgi:hypothetical protein
MQGLSRSLLKIRRFELGVIAYLGGVPVLAPNGRFGLILRHRAEAARAWSKDDINANARPLRYHRAEIALRKSARRILARLAQDNALLARGIITSSEPATARSATWKSYAFWAKAKLNKEIAKEVALSITIPLKAACLSSDLHLLQLKSRTRSRSFRIKGVQRNRGSICRAMALGRGRRQALQ